MEDVTTAPVLRVSDAALTKVLDILAAEDEPETLGLRVAVTGTQNGEFTYDLSFEVVAEAEADDRVYTQGDLRVMVPADSVESLDGATLDLPSTVGQGGLVIRNPNRPDPLSGMNLELTGTVAEKVTTLLDKQINPALAAHGGFASLVGVEEAEEGSKVVLTMGGGCQGCAVSAMTLRDGIDRSIREHIPEVVEVIDATDHDAGENPFYTDEDAASPVI